MTIKDSFKFLAMTGSTSSRRNPLCNKLIFFCWCHNLKQTYDRNINQNSSCLLVDLSFTYLFKLAHTNHTLLQHFKLSIVRWRSLAKSVGDGTFFQLAHALFVPGLEIPMMLCLGFGKTNFISIAKIIMQNDYVFHYLRS